MTATVAASATTVYHGLKRVPQGWIVANRNANATVWATSAVETAETITLQASAPVTVTLVVF